MGSDLSRRAREWRGQRRRAIALECGAALGGWSAAALGASALLDRFAALPAPARGVLLAVWALGAARLAWSRGLSPWRALDWDEVFAEAARRWPRSRPMLASAWALREGGAPGTSDELRRAHVERAERLAQELPPEPLYAWSPARGTRRLLLAGGAALLLNAAFGDRASWLRAAAPWSGASLERWAALEPGDAALDWGASALVRARLKPEARPRGLRAGALVLEAKDADGGWRAVPWTRVDEGEASWSAGALNAPLEYRLRWRELRTRAYRLTPVPPPRFARARAIVRGRGERRFELGQDPEVRARRGDWITVEGESEGTLASAALKLAGQPALALRGAGKRWTGGFPAEQDASFGFELVAADGRRDPSPPVYLLKVAADAPPSVELLSPQVPLLASPEDAIPVAYAARDDGEITRLALVVKTEKGPARELPLPRPSPGETLGDYLWALEGLPAGARAEFWLEAWDDASPPQRARSESGRVELVDARAEHEAALAARGAAEAALERAAARAEASRAASERGDLAASAEETRRLRQEWEAAARALRSWADKAGGDPRGDPGLAEEAARAAEEFAGAGEEGLPAAERALAQQDARRAAAEQGALAEQARGVQKALREGARAQSVQDLAERTRRAGRDSEALSRAAESLAARGPEGSISGRELEKLEEELREVEKALEELRQALARLPETVPDENAELRALPVDSARRSAAELRRAIESGDVRAAAEAARRLAEQLKQLSRTLDEAGRQASESRGRRSSAAAGQVMRSWQAAAEGQLAAVESARRLDQERVDALLEEQKALVEKAREDFERALSSASAALPPQRWPNGAWRPAAEAARLLRSGDAANALLMLKDAAARLRAAPPQDGAEPARQGLLAAADAASGALEKGASGGPPADAARSAASADMQRRALGLAETLRGDIRAASRELGFLSGRLLRRVEEAAALERAGEAALRRGDSAGGLKSAEAALAILQEGEKEAQSAADAARSAAGSMGGSSTPGLSVRGAPRGSSGARLGRVRLPSADEYKAPRQLREELERSLREPRPAAHDAEIKEYFKRLSR